MASPDVTRASSQSMARTPVWLWAVARLCNAGVAIFLCVLSFVLSPARAEAQRDRGVRLDGNLLFRVGPTENDTAEARAQRIESRLSMLLQRATGLEPVVRRLDDRASRDIEIGGVDIVTVTAADAAANGEDVDRLAAAWAEQIRAAVQQARARRSSAWQRFRAQVRGSIRSAVAHLGESLADTLPRTFAAVIVIALVWSVAAVVRRLTRAGIPRLVRDVTVQNLMREVAYYSVWAVGFLVALDAMGFNPQTFVTGLGLTGIALGFALKDILSNLVSGILLQALRPFELGDEIVVGTTEGRVEAIDLRATHIRAYDGRLILVPNGEVFTSRVTNNTASPVLRGSVEIHVSYKVDFAHALSVARDAAQATHGVAAEPPAYARIREANAGGVTMEVRFWTDSRRADFMATSCAVRVAVVIALKNSGVGLPDPAARELALRNLEGWRSALATNPSQPC